MAIFAPSTALGLEPFAVSMAILLATTVLATVTACADHINRLPTRRLALLGDDSGLFDDMLGNFNMLIAIKTQA
jgi:hypothetical protein